MSEYPFHADEDCLTELRPLPTIAPLVGHDAQDDNTIHVSTASARSFGRRCSFLTDEDTDILETNPLKYHIHPSSRTFSRLSRFQLLEPSPDLGL